MMKNYLLKLLQHCSEEKFGQDAIEWAVGSGLVRLTYDLDRDVQESMSRYDEIIEAYRRALAQKNEELVERHAPMERAVPRQPRAKTGTAASTKKQQAA